MIRIAGDNFIRATLSVDGVHLGTVSKAVYKTNGGTNVRPDRGMFGSTSRPVVDSNRTLKDLATHEFLECPRMSGKQPGPSHLLENVLIVFRRTQRCTSTRYGVHTSKTHVF